VNFKLGHKEAIVILGESGCGKNFAGQSHSAHAAAQHRGLLRQDLPGR
jgi:ABC-type dipeptide/oligopeptide/nickel transport system ATPase component